MSSGQSRRRQAGFIISLEFLLFTTILVIGSLAGVIAVRNAIFTAAAKNVSRKLIKDSTAPTFLVVGKTVNYNLCEQPQIRCPDPRGTFMDPDDDLFALIGVIPRRFTSRDRIYFDGINCTGDAYIASPGDDDLPTGGLNALQGRSYGVGPPDSWPCTFDATATSCTDGGLLYTNDAAAGATPVLSVWTSMDPDCFQFSGSDPLITTPVVETLARYPFTAGSAASDPPTDPNSTAGSVTATQSAPDGGAIIGAGTSGTCSAGCGANVACICFDDPTPATSPEVDPGTHLEFTVSCAAGTMLDPTNMRIRRAVQGVGDCGQVELHASRDGFTGEDITVDNTDVDATAFATYVVGLGALADAPTWSFRLQPGDRSTTVGSGCTASPSALAAQVRVTLVVLRGLCVLDNMDQCRNVSAIAADTLSLQTTTEVLDANGDNVLTHRNGDPLVPPFSIMPPSAWPDPVFTVPMPEGAPIQALDPTGAGAPGDPLDLDGDGVDDAVVATPDPNQDDLSSTPVDTPAAGPEDDPPPPQPPMAPFVGGRGRAPEHVDTPAPGTEADPPPPTVPPPPP